MRRKAKMKGQGLQIRAAAESDDPLRNRNFEMVAYTGGMLNLSNWQHPLIIDLEGISTLNSSPPALYGHNDEIDDAVGYLTKVTATASDLLVEGVLTPTCLGDRACKIIQKAAKGYRWQVSVGCDVVAKEFVPDGQTVVVNSRTFRGPVFVARQSVLSEASFVVLGADERTSARIAARKSGGRNSSAVKAGTMSFEDWLKSLGMDPATMSAEQLALFKTVYEKMQAAQEGGGESAEGEGEDDEEGVEGEGEDTDTEDEEESEVPARSRSRKAKAGRVVTPVARGVSVMAKKKAAEYRRIAALESVCAKHPKILARALERNWSVEKAELEVVRASRAPVPAPATGAAPDKPKVVEAALLLSVGMQESHVGKLFDENTMHEAVSARNRGVSIHTVMDDIILASGQVYRGSRKTEAFVKATVQAERTIQAAGNFTGVSFVGLLENVAEKSLKVSYLSAEVTWPLFCYKSSNVDFKPTSRVRLDSRGAFQKVGPDGELKHAGLADAKFSTTLETWGTIIALTRQMMINDDLNSFLELPTLLGRMGSISIEEEVYKLLLSNAGNFYHASNGNLLTGAEFALSIAAITAAEEKFANLVDKNGKPILATPKIMLVGTNNKSLAESIYKEGTVVATTTADKPLTANNPHAGKFQVVSSPYLNNVLIKDRAGKAMANQSQTGWYLFADPQQVSAMVVAFLNGQQTPTIESAQTEFSTLGMQWRAYHDSGIGFEDPAGSIRVTGVDPA